MGNPGGLFHLRDGAVIAVDSSGSPGAETLLLCSGRISEEDWTAALSGGAETRSHQAALIARGTIESTELQVLAMAAAQDGAFATAAGDIERYLVVDDDPIDVLLPVPDGVAPDLLLQETARRLDALASLPFPLSPYQERVVPVCGTESPALTAGRREIIAHATGRRNARDIAFAAGRSVYSTTVEISQMLSEDLLEIAPPATLISPSHWGSTSLRPRAEVERAADPGIDQVTSLPTRRPGRAISDSQNNLRPSGWHALSDLFSLSETESKHAGL
ncbi:hypothetical protein BC739_003667 [Kutzneria viridogrisea]|uniref:Uncharacterized protein n=1 Tax=Kutzneria viridogrisea TaxID=47990 RepID=A0ABR6BHV8_9PSEU|nr:MarR family transcriptional regulator [Kutzneria albida]MBA8926468.1 hypothetical protein [Kutzneria viridogrisea]